MFSRYLIDKERVRANIILYTGIKYLILKNSFIRGERGIRTPGGVTLNGFQDRRNRPLCHLSGAKIQLFSF